jgi:hypothetical protein
VEAAGKHSRLINTRLYLYLCVYNRPFDYQGQELVALETSAFIYVLEMTEQGACTLIGSDALWYENEKNPNEDRKVRIRSYFSLSKDFVTFDVADIPRMRALKRLGFADIDALHIALAEKARADYFVTCDYDMIRCYSRKNIGRIHVPIKSLTETVAMED